MKIWSCMGAKTEWDELFQPTSSGHALKRNHDTVISAPMNFGTRIAARAPHSDQMMQPAFSQPIEEARRGQEVGKEEQQKWDHIECIYHRKLPSTYAIWTINHLRVSSSPSSRRPQKIPKHLNSQSLEGRRWKPMKL